MSGQHTQGRLVVRGQPDMPNALYVADDPRNQIVSEGATPPDARRLAACWNALIGASTEEIESATAYTEEIAKSIGKVGSRHDGLAAECNQLRAELGEVLGRAEGTMAENDRLHADLLAARSHEATAVALLRDLSRSGVSLPVELADRIRTLLGDAP